MRFAYACFKGYIGFYNGSGLEKVEIDFTKGNSNIVLIHGKNGSGKSTLLNSLNVFPDPSSSFVPGMDGEKILTIFDNGDVYNLRIFCPADVKGGRKQTKAFISKNGLELNDNGNVTSYKEIIFSEFELDSNYISLSKLSGDDRGMGDKTPAERKRFVSSIIENLDIYNDMYKTLNKKSLIFKSHINTLGTKIQNIGSKENLQATISSLSMKRDELNALIIDYNNKIVAIEAKSSIDEEEANRIQQLTEQRQKLEDEIAMLSSKMKVLAIKSKVKEEEIVSVVEADQNLIAYYTTKISEYRSVWREKSDRLVSIDGSLKNMEASLTSLNANVDRQLEDKYAKSNQKMTEINDELKGLGINIGHEDIKFVIASVLEIYEEFIQRIDYVYSFSNKEMLEFMFKHNLDPSIIEGFITEQDRLKQLVSELDNKISQYKKDAEDMSVLENRPDKCKVDTCYFIAKAVKLSKKYDGMNLVEEIATLESYRDDYLRKIKGLDTEIEVYKAWINLYNAQLRSILDKIVSHQDYFVLVNDVIFADLTKIQKMFLLTSQFNEQRDPKRLRDALNLLNMRDSESETNLALSYEYQAYREKIQLINTTSAMVEKLKSEKTQLTEEASASKKEMDNFIQIQQSLSATLDIKIEYKNIFLQIDEIRKKKEVYDVQLAEFEKKSSKAMEELGKIREYRIQIGRLQQELSPIVNEINRLTGQLTILESYYVEYNEYKEKYNVIETLKKYCSPTGGGIQTIFMQLYMSKTLELSNQVLSMLFGGEYRLLDFIINQNEFRIPFVGAGLPVDDISSGSSSQISIMGMVINLVLLHQGSTKFNIARLDEVDGPLDNRNRLEFVETLFKIIMILSIEQLFIISHSIEVDASNVDIIKLKGYNDYDTINGNVIFDYRESTT